LKLQNVAFAKSKWLAVIL